MSDLPEIKFSWSTGSIIARLRSTATAQKLLDALPLESNANIWGDEVYFSAPLDTEAEDDATDVVDLGAVCYWLQGDCIALLFGPTPVSQGDECRLISEANIVGQLEGDLEVLRNIKSGDLIQVERL